MAYADPVPLGAGAVPTTSPSYASMLGRSWSELPVRTRARFGVEREMVCYHGRVVASDCTLFGRFFRQLARLVGSPLPFDDTIGPATVVVMATGRGGSSWTRVYRRNAGRTQAIRSVKRFAGPTGLEEYLGAGLCMALRVRVENTSLLFESAGYSWAVGNLRIPFPNWLTPGRLLVRSTELAAPCFRFCLTLNHPRFGEVLRQEAVFEDPS
ncbi:MAG: DUF4166 domain-containing protein [Gammaproteobacteria bacterium]|nr:DUF4166 domain-containing protein [Gammaproteobacteria bacterium]